MKARLYRFRNGRFGVQIRFFKWFWIIKQEPDEIGNEICHTTGMKIIYQREDKEEAQQIVDNINLEGPVEANG